MSDDLFGLDAPATSATTAATPPAATAHAPGDHHPQLAVVVVCYLAVLACVASLTGLAFGLAMLAQARQERAAARLAAKPFICFLIGAVALVVPLAGLRALIRHGIFPGRVFLICLVIAGLVCGITTCARVLGARALPGRPPIVQTAVGISALALALAAPPGWPAAFIAIPLGLGAWLTAGRANS